MVRTTLAYCIDSKYASNCGVCTKGTAPIGVMSPQVLPHVRVWYHPRLCRKLLPAPQDIQAAGGGKAQAIGVLTGVYSRQDLEGCGAGVLPAYLSSYTWLCASNSPKLSACKGRSAHACCLMRLCLTAFCLKLLLPCRINHFGEPARRSISTEGNEPIGQGPATSPCTSGT